MRFKGPSPLIINSTIAGNYSEETGGGIYCKYKSNPTIVNSIVWGNIGGGIPNDIAILNNNNKPSHLTITYSDINSNNITTEGNGSWSGNNNITSDPLFVNHLPATEIPTTAGDYHLQSGSPCIDSGTDDTGTYPSLPTDDIDGAPRPYDVPGMTNNPTAYDMGADKYVPTGDVDGDDCIGMDDVSCLYQWVIGNPDSCLKNVDVPSCNSCDVDGNGRVDIMDVLCLHRRVLGNSSCLGSADVILCIP